jgi:hypothetical protein
MAGHGRADRAVVRRRQWLVAASAGAALLATAGALAATTGAAFKFRLITRAGFHHGIVLPRMPVRGVPRAAA